MAALPKRKRSVHHVGVEPDAVSNDLPSRGGYSNSDSFGADSSAATDPFAFDGSPQAARLPQPASPQAARSPSPDSSSAPAQSVGLLRRPLTAADSFSRRGNHAQSLINRLGADGDALAAVVNDYLAVDEADDGTADILANEQFDEDDIADMLAAEALLPGAVASAAAAPAGSSGSVRDVRVDLPDNFTIFGDVSKEATTAASDNFFAIALYKLALRFLIPQAAITMLLLLFHGTFGAWLGIKPHQLVRTGPIPKTAHTLYIYAGRVALALNLSLLEPASIPLPYDDNLRGRGSKRAVDVHYGPDLSKSIALKLMNPDLNSQATPMHFLPISPVPDGFFCADTYYSDEEHVLRLAALAAAKETLPGIIAAQLPGVDPGRVGQIAVGLSTFIDAVSPTTDPSAAIDAFLIGISNMHTATAQSAQSVVLAGLCNSPGVLSQLKVLGTDVSVRASPQTLGFAEQIQQEVYAKVIAHPMRKLLDKRNLIVRASSLQGLPPNYPHQVRRNCRYSIRCIHSAPSQFKLCPLILQYVALTFYLAHVEADAPMLAAITGKTENHCCLDGAHGPDLGVVSCCKYFVAFRL